jgi:hypothetical protein
LHERRGVLLGQLHQQRLRLPGVQRRRHRLYDRYAVLQRNVHRRQLRDLEHDVQHRRQLVRQDTLLLGAVHERHLPAVVLLPANG